VSSGAVTFGAVAFGVVVGAVEVSGVAFRVLDSWFAGVDAAFGAAVEAAAVEAASEGGASKGGTAGIVCVRAALLRKTATAGARRKR